jgi:methylated-DNA-protein-cysteine methyltransferase-like protein
MNFFSRITLLVQKIPKGQVATYGQIAALAGNPRASRMVGWALHSLPEKKLETVPWHRVINREGRISTTCLDHTAELQALLLKKEGIRVELKDGNYYADLKKYLWRSM